MTGGAVAWGLAALGLLGAFYIVLGYPLLLWGLKLRKAPAAAKNLAHQPSVSVVMAVFNGEKLIQAKLETLCDLEYPAELLEIIIVSDGSTDQTCQLVREFAGTRVAGTPKIILIEAPKGGKAACLNLGFARAQNEILFLTDVRQPLEPSALRHLAANFADSTVGAVTGEMHLRRGDRDDRRRAGRDPAVRARGRDDLRRGHPRVEPARRRGRERHADRGGILRLRAGHGRGCSGARRAGGDRAPRGAARAASVDDPRGIRHGLRPLDGAARAGSACDRGPRSMGRGCAPRARVRPEHAGEE